MSNLSKLLNQFKQNFPSEYKSKVDIIETFVKDYIQKQKVNVKFLNSCATGFSGVRTRDQVIICSPMNMRTIGDFLYTIFHEIRHDQQVRDIKMPNPFTDFDLDDLEKLNKHYWEMELDADQFAKNMVAKLVIKLGIPIQIAKQQFKLSSYIENYPMMSQGVLFQLSQIINQVKEMKKSGVEYTDIQDHPMVKKYISQLEDFI